MLRTSLFRSDSAGVLNSSSATTTVWTSTREASPTETLVPMLSLTIGFQRSGAISFVGSTPIQRPARRSGEAVAGGEPVEGGSRETAPSPSVLDEAVVAGVDERDLRTEPATDSYTDAGLASPEPEQVTDEGSTPVAQAIDPSPSSATEPPTEEAASQSGAGSHTIELSIDSLPHFQLIEPIPVTINSLGDRLFTATVAALRLSGTGDTLGDALVTVKEQLEALYQRLAKSTGLSEDEKSDLQYLNSHVRSPSEPLRAKRGLWR